MASEKQFAANRANAKKSTGPQTAEGKAKVATNALKHGLLSRDALLKGESADEFVQFARCFLEGLQPFGVREEDCVIQLISISWRLRRVPAIEAGVFRRNGEQILLIKNWLASKDESGNVVGQSAVNYLGTAFDHAAQHGDALSKLIRYENSLSRRSEKLLEELERLQEKRLNKLDEGTELQEDELLDEQNDVVNTDEEDGNG